MRDHMNTRGRFFPLAGALIGALAGYLVVHPFGVVVHELFHVHEGEGLLHLHWGGVGGAIAASFGLAHLPQALSFAVLTGAAGYLFGKVMLAYGTIDEQSGRFAVIGRNISQILHDAKSPAAVIVTHAHHVKREVGDPELAGSCDAIERQARRFLGSLEDINLIACREGPLPLDRTLIRLRPFMEKTASEMKLRHEVVFEGGREVSASVDRDCFERITWNILTNASDALGSRKDGRIRVGIGEKEGRALIEFADNGPGIPGDVLPRLFELGFSSGKPQGTGIGLYSCKRLVEAHGGSIRIMSRAGDGATVRVEIPHDAG